MRITLCQVNPRIGDIERNAALVAAGIAQAVTDRADLLLTSELALCGYPPRDLLLRDGFVAACERAAERLAASTGPLTAVVGSPRLAPGGTRPLRNSALVLRDGRVQTVYDKRLLPGYDVFDEDRYFAPGDKPLAIDVAGRRIGILICEDFWRAEDVSATLRYTDEPLAETLSLGCDAIIALNASPFVRGKWQRHLQQLQSIARAHRLPIAAVNQAGANDDLIFDGRSVLLNADGTITRVLGGFEANTVTLDWPVADRSKFASGPTLRAAIETPHDQVIHWSDHNRELFHALTSGLRDYFAKTGHTRALIGLSGGIDSALTAVLAVHALGSANVIGVLMPSRYSSPGSVTDAQDVADALDMADPLMLPIREAHMQLNDDLEAVATAFDALDHPAPGAGGGVTDENVQSRLRGILLMALSNTLGALVLPTSNKSELAVGYSTIYGDMCGALSPLGDLTKTRLYALSRWINTHHKELGFENPPIPQSSIDKPPSAELRPNQTDQDSLPPYDLLDEIVERFIEHEQDEATIIRESGFDPAAVRSTLHMIDRAEFKRYQASIILKLTPRAFGPGRPMPVAMADRRGIPATYPGTANGQLVDDQSHAPIRDRTGAGHAPH